MSENDQGETAYAFNNSDIIATYDLDMDVWHPNRKHMALIASEILPFDSSDNIRILDLGVGTGYLTHKIALHRFTKKPPTPFYRYWGLSRLHYNNILQLLYIFICNPLSTTFTVKYMSVLYNIFII